MKTTTLLLAIAAIAGCASAPVPADKYGRVRETLAMAQTTPSLASEPRAMQHLELAKSQLREAKQLMIDGDNKAAGWVLMRAQADAETALGLAQAHSAQQDALATIQRIQREMQSMKTEGRGS